MKSEETVQKKQAKGFSYYLKKGWMKGVHVWNQTVILVFLFVIWWLFLTPTAFLWRLFKNRSSHGKEESFLKKSSPLFPGHFKRPF